MKRPFRKMVKKRPKKREEISHPSMWQVATHTLFTPLNLDPFPSASAFSWAMQFPKPLCYRALIHLLGIRGIVDIVARLYK